MKKIILFFTALLFLTSCGASGAYGYKIQERTISVENGFFQKGEDRLTTVLPGSPGRTKSREFVSRVGEVNGFAYSYNSLENGYVGLVANNTKETHRQISHLSGDWHIRCRKDRVNDRKSCIVSFNKEDWT